VIINFAVDSERNAVVLVGEGLRSTVNTHNAETFVCQNWAKLAGVYRFLAKYSLVEFAM
jgi:hypothetical protein